jgi:purine-binding chemotaxis protein CheW
MSVPLPDAPYGGDSAAEHPPRMLGFTLDGREFGVPIDPVVEIVGHRGATQVPHSGAAVEGILALRGRIVTVVDVRRRLGLPPRLPGLPARVIVIESAGDRVGLVVDSVTGVSDRKPDMSVLDLDDLLKALT